MKRTEAVAVGVEDKEGGVAGKLEAGVLGVAIGEPHGDKLFSQDVADEIV